MQGDVRLRGRRQEVAVHRVESRQHLLESLGPDRDHGAEADRGVHAVATANPIPESEHVGGVDAKGRYTLGVGGHRDEVSGDGVLPHRGDDPIAGRASIGERLLRPECLRGDDEEGLRRIEITQRL